MSRKNHKAGFTIIEFVLAMAFIGIILVAICAITIQITGIYQKGLALRAINSTGRQIMDDMMSAVTGSSIVTDINPSGTTAITDDMVLAKRKSYFQYNSINDSRQASGIFCTGSFDYVWNTADTLKDNSPTSKAVLINGKKYKFARIEDNSRKYCDPDATSVANIVDTSITEADVIELINSDESDLAIYDFTVYPAMQSESTRHILYPISMIIATKRGGININGNGDFCSGMDRPYDEEDANNEFNMLDFNYCAVNRFDFVVRQTGESSEIDGYGSR